MGYKSTFRGGGYEGYTDYPDLEGTFGTPGKYELINQDDLPLPLPSQMPKAKAARQASTSSLTRMIYPCPYLRKCQRQRQHAGRKRRRRVRRKIGSRSQNRLQQRVRCLKTGPCLWWLAPSASD